MDARAEEIRCNHLINGLNCCEVGQRTYKMYNTCKELLSKVNSLVTQVCGTRKAKGRPASALSRLCTKIDAALPAERSVTSLSFVVLIYNALYSGFRISNARYSGFRIDNVMTFRIPPAATTAPAFPLWTPSHAPALKAGPDPTARKGE